MKLKEKWASLFIPKNTPYCHHRFEKNVAGNYYAKPCKYWCLEFDEYKEPTEYCKLLKKKLTIQDQVKDCGINEDYIDEGEIRHQLEEVKQATARLNNKNLELKVKLKNQEDEIERLQKLLDIEKNKRKQFDKDNQKLHSIIKEVREYIKESYDVKVTGIEGIANFMTKRNKELLEILDKENK